MKFILTILVGAILSLSARAEETNVLSLKDAEAIVLKTHPRITAADLIALASRQEVREARSAFFPTLAANLTAVGTTAQNTRIAAGALNNPLILNRDAAGFNITQLITDFGRTANLTASSKLNARAQEQNALATRAQVLLQVASVYYAALQAQSVLRVAQQTIDTRQSLFEQVSVMATNKLRSGLDVSFAKVSLDQSRLLLAQARNDYQAQIANLENLLGERTPRAYRLRDEPAPTNAPMDDMTLVDLALRDRPDLAQLRFARDAATRYARAERDLQYPTLNLMGAAGVIPDHEDALRANYAAAGVNLNIPIFEGMRFSALKKEADLRAQAASESLRDSENNVIRDVRVGALNLSYAAEEVTLTESLLASANEAFDLAQARYHVGSSSVVEFTQAQLSQTQAEIAEAQARFEYQIRQAILSFQTGQLR
jgi:outer membrane protein